MVYLWNLYIEIKANCEFLTYSELESFAGFSGVELSPWEASLMLELERLRKKHG